MEYIRELFLIPSVTQSIVLLTLVVCLGLWAGEHLRIKNFSLGITWILFVGIIFSSFGITIDPQVSHFAKNFGLILFVDKWKEDQLVSIRQKADVQWSTQSSDYDVWGVPFFTEKYITKFADVLCRELNL